MITHIQSFPSITNAKIDGSSIGVFKEVPAEELQFRIFSQLSAIASLFHMAHSSVFDQELNFALLTLCAFYVIFKPSVAGLVALALLQIFDGLFRMPYTTNHWIFTTFMNVTILQALLYRFWKDKTFSVRGGAWLKTFAPVVRIEVIILYFFAVFHKLNADFFAPLTSCASDLLKAQNMDAIIPLTPELLAINAYFTIFIEAMIPILLCFKETRNFGIMSGLLFHCILSYNSHNAFYDFSSMVFAVYFLFANPTLSLRIYELRQNLYAKSASYFKDFSIRRTIIITVYTLTVLGIIYLLTKKMNSFQSVHLYFFWTFYSVYVGYCFIYFLIKRKNKATEEQTTFGLPHWSFVIMPVIIFFNGTLPYLGLKTENSYAMFSNLRTEGGKSNHFLIPASIQLFDYQKEVVEVISSSDAKLQKMADQKKLLVLFEFRNIIKDRKPERIDYIYKDEARTYLKNDKASHADLGYHSPILGKLMKFRPFDKEGPQECAH